MQAASLTQIRQLFEVNGESVAQWARTRGFSPALVYRVLRGETVAKRGQTHLIAVALGLKRPPTEGEQTIFRGGPSTAPAPLSLKGISM